MDVEAYGAMASLDHMTDSPDQPTEPDEEFVARRLTDPRDSLPDDPLAAVAEPQFPPALRGYDREAVDAYVERVTRLVSELNAVRSPRAAVRQALERVGAETTDILRRAHETAEQVTSSARAEADELTGRTRREADELAQKSNAEAQARLAEARAEAEGMIAEAQQRAQDLDRDADIIWQERARLIDDIRKLADDIQGAARAADLRYPPGPDEEEPAADEAPETPFDVERNREVAPAPEPDATMEIPAAELPDAGLEEEPAEEAEEAPASDTAEWPAAVAEDDDATVEWTPPVDEAEEAEAPRHREP